MIAHTIPGLASHYCDRLANDDVENFYYAFQVTRGQKLIDFDLNKIKEAGYDPTTMLVITNSAELSEFRILNHDLVKKNSKLLELNLKPQVN